MKKMMKRIGAVLLAVAMMAALSMSAWATNADPGNDGGTDPAAGGTTPAATSNVNTTALTAAPKSTDTGKVTVSGLEEGDSVIFYQIVDAKYKNDDTPFEKYFIVADPDQALFDTDGTTVIYPTADELTELANATTKPSTQVNGGTATDTGTIEANLPIGMWMALITPKQGSTKVYNPLVLSTYYANNDGSQAVEGGKIDVGTDTYNIAGTNVYAKSSEPEINKTILGNSVHDNNADTTVDANGQHQNGNKGDDHKVGDVVDFQVETNIPSYSKDYVAPIIYEISDTMGTGLTFKTDAPIVVKVGTETVAASPASVTSVEDDACTYLVNATATGFTIKFGDKFLRNNQLKDVVVTYSAIINENAPVNFDPASNTAKLKYSNDPTDTSKTKEKESKTYHYTFAIDGNITGSETNVVIESSKKKWGHELIKVNENGEPQGIVYRDSGETPLETTTTQGETIQHGLAGAEFEMWQIKDEDNNDYTSDKRWKAVTNANGYFVADSTKEGYGGFTQLDAGTYKFKEIKAPTGYTLDSTEHEVVISATYNTNGTLHSYTITVDGEDTSTYTATYGEKTSTTVKDVVITDLGTTQDTTYIKNTKTKELPSTGGIGTYVFTVAGVAIMVVAAGLLIVRHKKKA